MRGAIGAALGGRSRSASFRPLGAHRYLESQPLETTPNPEEQNTAPSTLEKTNGERRARPPREDRQKYFRRLRVEAVNGVDPEVAKRRPHCENLVPVFPDEMFDLEITGANITQRLINLITPIGLGQRALIVSPPKAGKTTVLKDI